nr:ATP-binding protein [Actinoplanes sp. N902-109]
MPGRLRRQPLLGARASGPAPAVGGDPGDRTLDDLVRQLKAADAIGRLTRKLRTYLRPHVLVVDEVGYQPLERPEANWVFQVTSKRYEKGSTLLTSNKGFGEWGQVLRRRSPSHRHPRPTPAPLRRRPDQRTQLPP